MNFFKKLFSVKDVETPSPKVTIEKPDLSHFEILENTELLDILKAKVQHAHVDMVKKALKEELVSFVYTEEQIAQSRAFVKEYNSSYSRADNIEAVTELKKKYPKAKVELSGIPSYPKFKFRGDLSSWLTEDFIDKLSKQAIAEALKKI